jgi:hypothetical protein
MRAEIINRTIHRWIHIIVSIPIYVYIYSPFEQDSGIRGARAVCLLSDHGAYGTLDVEGACRSANDFEESGVTIF